MKYKNMMEEITEWIFEEHSNSLNLKCNCDQCKMDVIAIALNHLPPQYIVQGNKEAYIKAKYIENQYRVDVLSQLASATLIVSENPRHSM